MIKIEKVSIVIIYTSVHHSFFRNSKYHAKRNAAPEYSVGDEVLLRNKRGDDRKGNKLETTWSTTVYEVETVKGRNTYYISNNGVRLRKLVNSFYLKKYIE